MNKCVLFRAEANDNIGIGHIMRCLTIAEALCKRGYEPIFMYSERQSIPQVAANGYREIKMDSEDPWGMTGAEEILTWMKTNGVVSLIVDNYAVNNEFLSVFQEQFVTVINSRRERYSANILLNYSIVYDSEFYEKSYSKAEDGMKSSRLLLGAKYIPIRGSIRDYRYSYSESVRKALVLTGGGDRLGFMEGFIREMICREQKNGGNPVFPNIKFTCIVGAMNEKYELLHRMTEGKEYLEVIPFTDRLGELMQESDLAITAGGTTIYELGAVGVPMIVYSLAADQIAEPAYLNNKNCLSYCGTMGSDDFFDRLFQHLYSNIYEKDLRREHINRFSAVIDGKGADRIAKIVAEEAE